MKLLLDTRILLWAAAMPEKLPDTARKLLENTTNDLIFSVASLWEIAIKSSLRHSELRVDAIELRRGLLQRGYRELNVTGPHALAASNLPLLHRDPFDRMLVAQATVESMVLLTMDKVVSRYPGPIELV